MPSTAMSWDGYGGQIFPAAMSFHHHHQDTLEAVFQQPESTAPLQAPEAAGERELLLRNGSPVPVSVDAAGGVHAAAARRKRPFRTDRHSKIRTAQGVRDRRIRLSVPCAREFFALQDLLRFDKPSETLNWLFTQAKPAIDRLGDAAEPAGVVSGAPPTVVVVKGRGEGSSSSTCCLTAANSREEATEKGRSRGGGGPHGPTALMEEQGGGELGWIMTEDTAAAAVTAEQPQQMDALDYYYLYCQQLEEMAAMRCNGGTPR